MLRSFLADESGATAIEYGLMAGLIAVGAILAFTVFGTSLNAMFGGVADKSASAMNG
jgi:pilus assembly protein Flp/PilA